MRVKQKRVKQNICKYFWLLTPVNFCYEFASTNLTLLVRKTVCLETDNPFGGQATLSFSAKCVPKVNFYERYNFDLEKNIFVAKLWP